MDRREQGFTLTELLVAIAIVGIVSAIAVPLYTQYSQRAFVGEVQADMLTCGQALERRSALNFTYAGTADTDADGIGDGNVGPIAADVCTPLSVNQLRYVITINAPGATYTLTATPADPGAMADTGFMTLNDAGIRQWDENDNGVIDAGEADWNEG